jgi:gliding motility-associated-like protein
MRTLLQRAGLCFAILFYFLPAATAQIINYSNPEDLTVCDSAVFAITIANDDGFALTGGQLTIELPPCISYSLGSVSGAVEADVSDLSQPVFSVPSIAPDAVAEVAILQVAGCDCVDLINMAEPFLNEIDLTFDTGSAALNTDLYEVETPLLVITDVVNAFLSGQQGEVLQRSFTVRNTRLGPLSSFRFSDTYQAGISVSASPGTPLVDLPGSLEIELTGTDFTAIGDGDALFEFGEELTITETILINDCGIDLNSALSAIELWWGCFDLICQDEQQNAVVAIQPYDLLPELVFEPFTTVPYCFCGPEGHLQGWTITNTGTGPAVNIELFVRTKSDETGIDVNSVLVDSIGGSQSLSATGIDLLNFDPDCIAPPEVYQEVAFVLPALGPGESVFVHWNQYFCKKSCNQPEVSWFYEYQYNLECPEGFLVEAEEEFTVEALGEPLVTDLFDASDCGLLIDETTCTYTFTVAHDTLDVANGHLSVELFLPCGYYWETLAAPPLAGVEPEVYSVSDLPTSTYVYLEYPLPLPVDSSGFDFAVRFDCESLCFSSDVSFLDIQTTCPVYQGCNPPESKDIDIGYVASLNTCMNTPDSCAVQSCGAFKKAFECSFSDTLVVASDGYYFYTTQSRRYNFGWPDNDNDHLPDGSGSLEMDSIAQLRFLPGDTILTEVAGIVIADSTGATYDNFSVEVGFLPQAADPDINPGLFDPEGIPVVSAELTVFDFSANTYYSCPITTELFSTSDEFGVFHAFDISLAEINCGWPQGFSLAHADSVFVTVLSTFQTNPVQENSSIFLPPLMPISVGATAQVSASDPEVSTLNCGCDADLLELAGYTYSWTNGVFVVPPCDTSEYLGANFFNFGVPLNDLFPYEYRWGALLSQMEMTLAPGFSLVDSRVSRIQWQDGIAFKENVPIGADPEGDSWSIQLDSCQVPALDEGFSVLTQHRFLRDCQLDGAYPLATTISVDFLPQFPEELNPQVLVDSSNSLRALNPDLNLWVPIQTDISSDNKFRWDLQVENIVNAIASQTSGALYNVWIAPVSTSGLVSNFQLEDLDQGGDIPQDNGLFQLGELAPEELRNLRLIGDNAGCGLDSVRLHYGWNCAPLTSLSEESCWQNSVTLEGESPDGEIEMQVFSPVDTCFALCDTVPYHTIEIFNANLGAFCDLELAVYLPDGFQILPGSCELDYPVGTGFLAIPDPVPGSNGQLLFDFNSLSDSLANNCLAGVALSPANSLQLRFLGLTDCDFTINSDLLFVAEGTQTCGEEGNAVLRESDPFCIITDAPDGQAFLNAGLADEVVCADTATLNAAVLLDVETVIGDSLELVLPVGISYQPGSYAGISNAPAGEPVIGFYGVQQVLFWGLPVGVTAGTVISFELDLMGLDALDCGEAFAFMRATRETEAFCAASEEECSVNFELGSELIVLPIDRPVLEITAFEVAGQVVAGGLVEAVYNLQVENLGAPLVQDLVVQLWIDSDASGGPSPGDQLWLEELVPDFAGSTSLSGAGTIPPEALCHLMAVIDPVVHCTCSGAVAFADGPIAVEVFSDSLLCSAESLELGWCLPGFTTEWPDTSFLSCVSCCPATFQFSNGEVEPVDFTYQQLLTDSTGCLIEAGFALEVLPELGILFADTIICAGDSANLLATPAALYLWEGPGIQNPEEQGQTVSPTGSSWYFLTVADAGDCIYEDSVFVQVNPLPLAAAGPDMTYCVGDTVQLNAQFDPTWTYAWEPAAALSDPNVADPFLLVEEPIELTLEVTSAAGCVAFDSVSLDFAPLPEIQLPEDYLLCLGLTDTVSVVGANEYLWSPAVVCLDPACSTVVLEPTADVTYAVTGISELGCQVTDSFSITVVDESIQINEAVSTCVGEPVDIFGELVEEAGIYCDTVVLAAGCLQVTCIDLTVFEASETEEAATICPGATLEVGGLLIDTAGTYSQLFQNWLGCDSTWTIEVTEYELAPLSITPSAASVFAGQTVEVEVAGGGPDYTYSWEVQEGLSCTDCPNPIITPTNESAEYFVTITDEKGCTQQLSVRIDITTDCESLAEKVPSAFTPNGDGLNDRFEIPGAGFQPGGVEMQIWNRWGELVYREISDNPSWDGLQDGELAPADVYVYRLIVVCSAEETADFTGDLLLMR